MDQLGHHIRELRRKLNYSQEDLARTMGLSLSTIQRWEKQGGNPNRLTCRELDKLFKKAGIDFVLQRDNNKMSSL